MFGCGLLCSMYRSFQDDSVAVWLRFSFLSQASFSFLPFGEMPKAEGLEGPRLRSKNAKRIAPKKISYPDGARPDESVRTGDATQGSKNLIKADPQKSLNHSRFGLLLLSPLRGDAEGRGA